MNKLTQKLNKILRSKKLDNFPVYLMLIVFLFNLASNSLPLASAQDRNMDDYGLIALANAQNPDYSAGGANEDNGDENIFIEAPCVPGLDCPEDLLIKTPNIQNGYKNAGVDPLMPAKIKAVKKIIVTAYSSTPDQTDASPFVTANGTFVRDGIIACNFLPFGAKVRFPDYSGDKIYTVQDRMAWRNSHKMDIWMESRSLALEFGVKRLTVEILE